MVDRLVRKAEDILGEAVKLVEVVPAQSGCTDSVPCILEDSGPALDVAQVIMVVMVPRQSMDAGEAEESETRCRRQSHGGQWLGE